MSGKGKDVSLGRWDRQGVDSLLYGYSANSHKSYTRIDSWQRVYMMFINAIVITTCMQKWRDDMGIGLGKTKFLSFKTKGNENLFFGGNPFFDVLAALDGKLLKKEFFHPDYEDRLNPFIKYIYFTISESGCHIFLGFTFEGCEGSSWTKEFWMRNEPLEDFLLDSLKKIESWLLTPQIFTNDPM